MAEEALREELDPFNRCPICLQEFDDKVGLDACAHAFCRFCILQWTEFEPARRHGKNRCPLCRTQFKALTFDFDVETKHFDIVYIDDSPKFVHWSQLCKEKAAIDQQRAQQQKDGLARRRRALVYVKHLIPIIEFRIPLLPEKLSIGHARVVEKTVANFEARATTFLSRELPILLAHEMMPFGLDSFNTQQNEISLLTDLILGAAPGAMADLIRFTHLWSVSTNPSASPPAQEISITPNGDAKAIIDSVGSVIGQQQATILIRELMVFVLSNWSLAQFDSILTYSDPSNNVES